MPDVPAGDVLAEALARLSKGEVPAPDRVVRPSAPQVGGYEAAASVLGWFDPARLRPLEPASRHELDELVAEATPVTDDKGARRLSIRARRRVQVLRHLRQRDLVVGALNANKASKEDVLHGHLRDFAIGKTVDLDGRSLADLHSIALVCDWLRQAGFPALPDPIKLQEQIDRLALLEPLELLDVPEFVGRGAELDRLRELVRGTTKGQQIRLRKPRPTAREHRDIRMLVLHGPAGIGKSTLLARFLIEQAQREPRARVPFAYLDFDRPTLDSSHPLSVLSEAVAQLGVQVPLAKSSCRRIREEWSEVLEHERVSRTLAIHLAVRDIGTLVKSLELGDRPLLLVLDTFEVVQYRSSEQVAAILAVLDRLVEDVPAVRIVVAGRAGIPRLYADQLEISGLDQASAIAYLNGRGVTDPALAERIASRYARDPQSLKLAAADPDAQKPIPYLLSRAAEWFQQLDAAVIQRKLYERVLGHVHSPDVRALANPGLVVRRLTPEIVLGVLAQPCRLEIATLVEATDLCAELRREVSLVQEEQDGALVHRPDLRRTMLPLIEADQPAVSQILHQAAIAYYADRPPTPRERAEEIYHRLKSGESAVAVADRWLTGVEPFLIGALEEFGGARRAFLAARLGLAVDAGTSREARLEDWERLTERKVRAMLADDRPRDALTALGARRERSATSPLVSLTAEAQFRLGQVGPAIDTLGEAADAAWRDDHAEHASRLCRLQAELVVSAGAWELAQPVDLRLQRLEQHASDPVLALTSSAFRAAIALRVDPDAAAELRGRAFRRFDALADDVLAADPTLIRLTGSLMDDEPARLARAVTLAGLPHHEEGPVRVVAAELGTLDVALSTRHGEPAGMLARRHHIVGQARSLTAAWSAFLLGENDPAQRLVLCELLRRPGSEVATLAKAVARALAADPSLRRPTEVQALPVPDVVVEVNLAPDARLDLVDAVASHFNPESLRWFLRLRLHQSLSALVPDDQTDFTRTISTLVAALEAKGLLLEFVAHCLEVAPGDQRLLRAAETVGLSIPLRGDVAAVEDRIAAGGGDPRIWLSGLGRLEGQVCLVRTGDSRAGTGFLVSADLVLTSASLLGDGRPDDLRCRFDAKQSRDGRFVTSGVWYKVREVVAEHPEAASDDPGGWALLRVAGSPGVQPIGGDAVESGTGTLRGWLDVARPGPSEGTDRLLLLGSPEAGALRLVAGAMEVTTSLSDDYLYHRLPTSAGFAGAPLLTEELTPVGLHLGTGLHRDRPEVGVAVSLSAVRAGLERRGLGHLLGTRLS